MKKQSITILGSTGSIGTNTLDVVARHPDRFSVFALSANSNSELMLQQCRQYNPRVVVMNDPAAAAAVQTGLSGAETRVLCGVEAICEIAADPAVTTVMAAIVGGAGLPGTMAAVEAGKKVMLANKESLVMAGRLFMQAVRDNGATLLPIDSEHNAIFQCLPLDATGVSTKGVRRLLLTASGGPFLNYPMARLRDVTPDQACRHPNWTMGRKISVDSATMMNKGLELIEACHLFKVDPDQIDVVIHPQSVIHSMVDYIDGSVLAQLGNPDMRTPIAQALAWPERVDSGVAALDIVAQARLDFQAPDLERFPCLRLAMLAAKQGGGAQIALNAANEVAVDAFLCGRIAFPAIANVIERVLGSRDWAEPTRLDQVHSLDHEARRSASDLCAALSNEM